MKSNQGIIDAINCENDKNTPLLPIGAVVYLILWSLLIMYMVKDSAKNARNPELNSQVKTR